MTKNQKGLAPITIVLIVIALFTGGILTWQYFGIPKETREESEKLQTFSGYENIKILTP